MSFLRKSINALLTLLGVIILVFSLFQLLGDPAKLLMGQSVDKKTINNIRHDLYLDQPKWKQLLLYVNDLSPVSIYNRSDIENKKLNGFFIGNNIKIGIKFPYLGKSYQSKKSVASIIAAAIPATFLLALAAILLALILGTILGITAAVHFNSWVDKSIVSITVLGISAPSFFMAILFAYLFGIVLHQYTGLNFTGSLYEINEITGEKYLVLKNLILPAITLGIRPLAIITQLSRSKMLDVLSQDFIRTAYAKGLKKTTILLRHALRNILNPIVTTITGWFAELLAGAFFVEFIFGWKGLGKITIDALGKLDYPVVMGSIISSAFLFIIINMLSDFLQSKIDPRI
jgi:peptide/nickel transport system permease protein